MVVVTLEVIWVSVLLRDLVIVVTLGVMLVEVKVFVRLRVAVVVVTLEVIWLFVPLEVLVIVVTLEVLLVMLEDRLVVSVIVVSVTVFEDDSVCDDLLCVVVVETKDVVVVEVTSVLVFV